MSVSASPISMLSPIAESAARISISLSAVTTAPVPASPRERSPWKEVIP